MPFKKGQKKTGGKKKGTVNKKTLILDSFANDIVDGGMEKFRAELANLKGTAYVNAYMQLFEYVKPKLARTELSGDIKVFNTIEDKTHFSLKTKGEKS